MNKRGNDPKIQGLIILIAILIILYTLVMPPCERCQLLGDDCSEVCEGEFVDGILLEVSPGNLDMEYEDTIDHVLESVDLFIQEEPEVVTLSNSLEVRNGLFGELDQELDFSLNNIDSLDELSLSFAVIESKGNLIVTLNGKQIFNQKISENRIKTIDLPKEYLEDENKIRLQVSPSGLVFWSSNKYYLKDIKLRKEFELVHSFEILDFSVSSSEKNSIQESELQFFVFCKGNAGESNIMKTYLNNHLIFSKLVPCMSEEHTIELDEEDFKSGVNELKFSVSGGDYLISDIEIRNEVEGRVYPSYSFYIRNNVYDEAEDYYLNLEMFGDRKRAEIIVNDDTIDLNTGNTFAQFDIGRMIRKGNNFVEVRPDSEFSIDELKIVYE
ncbi:hypothetical protein HOG16_01175 [Candidatus Woesearchaeota archaeon]|jgi:hypothetical protein|nr:hypothetical protein [Candidatus Woesearchaeota archaeon]MBT4321695.1 hypothetical protein [Candidatus Woesearchaeota archaeon]MBT4630721.1 hypothetical protein [Candidatus Woesearchaeota archaeon]